MSADKQRITVQSKPRVNPPALFEKVVDGLSYMDTVRTLVHNSELILEEMGAQVTGKTRDEHLLMELAKGAKSVEAAHKMSSAQLGDTVGAVSQLDSSLWSRLSGGNTGGR